jgi:hypothetical protein
MYPPKLGKYATIAFMIWKDIIPTTRDRNLREGLAASLFTTSSVDRETDILVI